MRAAEKAVADAIDYLKKTDEAIGSMGRLFVDLIPRLTAARDLLHEIATLGDEDEEEAFLEWDDDGEPDPVTDLGPEEE